MAATTVLNFSDNDFKVRWREPYVSEALNRKVAGVIPRGVYRGFVLATNPAPLTVQLTADALAEHLAVYESLTGYSLTIRRGGGTITINLAAFTGQTVYIALYAVYSPSTTTLAQIRVYTVADYNSAPEKPELLVFGSVVVPGAGLIPASALSFSDLTAPWKESGAVAVRAWKQVVSNGSFDEGTGVTGATDTLQSIPGFRGEGVGAAIVASATTNPRSGTNALLMQFANNTDIGRIGPGAFDSTKVLSGGSVPVFAGQVVDVSFWLAGVNVVAYAPVTNGIRFVLTFYNASDVLQIIHVIDSDPAVHIGTFPYTALSDLFTAPVAGYFTWHIEGSMNLAPPAGGQFWIDDLRVFVSPRVTADDDFDNPVTVPAIRAMTVDILPDSPTSRATQNNKAARLSAKGSGSDTLLSLTSAGAKSTADTPRWDTPYILKLVDQDFTQGAFGISGTESTADQDTIPHAYKLLNSYRLTQTSPVRVRTYARTDPDRGYVVTVNARWGGGSDQMWNPDSTSVQASKTSFRPDGVDVTGKASTLVPWADGAWVQNEAILDAGDVNASNDVNAGDNVNAVNDITAGDSVYSTNDFLYVSGVNRSTEMKLTDGVTIDNLAALEIEDVTPGGLIALGGGSGVMFTVMLPPGAVLDTIRLSHDNNGGGSGRYLRVIEKANFQYPFNPNNPTMTLLVDNNLDNSSGNQRRVLGLNYTFADNAATQLLIGFYGELAGDRLLSLRLEWSDYGPKNEA